MHVLGEVAVRIDEGETTVEGKITERQGLHDRQFASASLAEDIAVEHPIGLSDAEPDEFLPMGGEAEVGHVAHSGIVTPSCIGVTPSCTGVTASHFALKENTIPIGGCLP